MNRPKYSVLTSVALIAALGVLSTLTGAAAPADDDQAIVHVLNRIGFGPRPVDVDRVRQLGLRKYIEDQLHLERIADESIAGGLNGFTRMNLSMDEIAVL